MKKKNCMMEYSITMKINKLQLCVITDEFHRCNME